MQDQVPDGGVDQSHLEYLRHPAALPIREPAFEHDREHHRCGLSDTVLRVVF